MVNSETRYLWSIELSVKNTYRLMQMSTPLDTIIENKKSNVRYITFSSYPSEIN